MRQAGSHELFAYWNALRRGRAAPERGDLDPAAIRGVLADTFMLEVDAEATYPFCLSGTRLNALFDIEAKGRSFLSLWREEQRPEMATLLRTVIDGVCPIVVGATAAPQDYAKTEFEMLLLPLRHLGKTHARVLGRIAPSKHPSWLGLLPIEALEFSSMRVLNAGDLNVAASRLEVNQTYPDTNTYFSSFEQRGHLRIYHGNT